MKADKIRDYITEYGDIYVSWAGYVVGIKPIDVVWNNNILSNVLTEIQIADLILSNVNYMPCFRKYLRDHLADNIPVKVDIVFNDDPAMKDCKIQLVDTKIIDPDAYARYMGEKQ